MEHKPIYISECGQYYAVPADTVFQFDVVERFGDRVWLGRRYQRVYCNDMDRRFLYPEFPCMVVGWSNRTSVGPRGGKRPHTFELTFCDLNQRCKWWPLKGLFKGIIAKYTAMFRKRASLNKSQRHALYDRVAAAMK